MKAKLFMFNLSTNRLETTFQIKEGWVIFKGLQFFLCKINNAVWKVPVLLVIYFILSQVLERMSANKRAHKAKRFQAYRKCKIDTKTVSVESGYQLRWKKQNSFCKDNDVFVKIKLLFLFLPFKIVSGTYLTTFGCRGSRLLHAKNVSCFILERSLCNEKFSKTFRMHSVCWKKS